MLFNEADLHFLYHYTVHRHHQCIACHNNMTDLTEKYQQYSS